MNKIKQDDAVKELLPKVSPSKQLPVNIKALCIILAYMLRMNELEETGKEDLEFIICWTLKEKQDTSLINAVTKKQEII